MTDNEKHADSVRNAELVIEKLSNDINYSKSALKNAKQHLQNLFDTYAHNSVDIIDYIDLAIMNTEDQLIKLESDISVYEKIKISRESFLEDFKKRVEIK